MPSRALQHSGVILWAAGGIYRVLLDNSQQVDASIRGRLKLEERTGAHASVKEERSRPESTRGSRGSLDRIVAGDRVVVCGHPDDSYSIEQVEPRSSELARTAPGRGHQRAKILVANVDQVVAVVAAARPDPNPRMLDRILVLAEMNDLPAIIIVNKVDLVDRTETMKLFTDYSDAGYTVLLTSAKEGSGIDEVNACICGRESVITGASGVGKSSLLNALQPGMALRTAEVSEAIPKGKHTTVAAQLMPLDCGGFIVDTPGIKEVGLFQLVADGLDFCFPEFRELISDCRFSGSCSHTHEPACAVRTAAHSGSISRARYESYCDLYKEARENADEH